MNWLFWGGHSLRQGNPPENDTVVEVDLPLWCCTKGIFFPQPCGTLPSPLFNPQLTGVIGVLRNMPVGGGGGRLNIMRHKERHKEPQPPPPPQATFWVRQHAKLLLCKTRAESKVVRMNMGYASQAVFFAFVALVA